MSYNVKVVKSIISLQIWQKCGIEILFKYIIFKIHFFALDIRDGENFIINMTQPQVNCYNCYNATKEPKEKISSPSLRNMDEDHIDPVKAS